MTRRTRAAAGPRRPPEIRQEASCRPPCLTREICRGLSHRSVPRSHEATKPRSHELWLAGFRHASSEQRSPRVAGRSHRRRPLGRIREHSCGPTVWRCVFQSGFVGGKSSGPSRTPLPSLHALLAQQPTVTVPMLAEGRSRGTSRFARFGSAPGDARRSWGTNNREWADGLAPRAESPGRKAPSSSDIA